jgi:hypothetical protein
MLAFRRNNSGKDFDGFVREIAERCASATLSQLSTAAERMSVAQLRGYVRAHAWPQVWAEAQDAVAGGRLTKSHANDLAAKVLEQTVHLVARAYLNAPVVAMPMPHIGRRTAA